MQPKKKRKLELEKGNCDLKEENESLKRALEETQNYRGKQVKFIFRNSPKRSSLVWFKALINLGATHTPHIVYALLWKSEQCHVTEGQIKSCQLRQQQALSMCNAHELARDIKHFSTLTCRPHRSR